MIVNLRSRVEELERQAPRVIVMTMQDGSQRSFPGLTPLEFVMRAKEQFKRGGGPMSDAILLAVSATRNMGRLHELMRAVWLSPVEAQGIEEPTLPLEAAPIKPFITPMPEDCPNN
jgi:hypothetical protein